MRVATRALLLCAALSSPVASTAQENGQPPASSVPPQVPATADAPVEAPYTPKVMPASGEAEAAIARFRVPEGFQVELWAAEPMLANPVAFHAADSGAVYVCESFRLHKGVTDIREHMDWLDDDQASRSVEDLVAMFEKHLGPEFAETKIERERLRVLRDLDGDGRADRARVFADAFGDPADGIGAGVLEVAGEVYFTCMPHLWQLSDHDGDDRADTWESLSYGYGVHVQFLGHDLHGLALGPDGYLYFSCGDRGLKVDLPNGVTIDHTEAGAVLRCELDGSGLELYATGLRNPQELVFDDFGNLFTGDNNGDGGDRARLVHVVLGGDSGWRNGWQWVDEPAPRGFFNSEKLWEPAFEGQSAWIVPPIANLGSGPSGIARDPGGVLPGPWRDRFLLCDFTGDPDSSSILAFTLEPKGSSFALGAVEPIVSGSLVTDCEIGPDGALWFSDWVEGWGQTGKGRIYRAFDPSAIASEPARETHELLVAGAWHKRGDPELAHLLGDRDQRVRLRAQLELARRGNEGWSRLLAAARSGNSLLARLHGLWGAGLQARRQPARDRAVFVELARDPEAQVRAQAARVLGDLRHAPGVQGLARLLNEEDPRVRLQAALALSRFGEPEAEVAVEPLLAMLREIGSSDPVLRHAGIQALSRCSSSRALSALRRAREADLRLAAVVALRRQASLRIGEFLEDPDPRVVVEAARAIYDLPLAGLLWPLAMLTRSETVVDGRVLRRSLHAHRRIGRDVNAAELARFALREDREPALRREALLLLDGWKAPHARDPLLGLWRPIAPRDGSHVPEVLRWLGQQGITKAPVEVARAWIELAGRHAVAEAAPALVGFAVDPKADVTLRVASLAALEELAPAGLQATLETATTDAQDEVRAAALSALERVAPQAALPYLALALRGARAERRAAYEALGRIAVPEAEALLAGELDRLASGLVPAELALDLVLACERRASEALLARLAEIRAPRAADPLLAPWLDALQGGDEERGRKIFRTKTELSCLRCHRIESPFAPNPEGGLVGPDLRGVGARLTRLDLAEAIADPNRRIGTGFRSSVVFLAEGRAVEGVVIEETQELLRLRDAEDQVIEIPLAEVEGVKQGLSSMPSNLADHLSREELRDLIEFLSRQ